MPGEAEKSVHFGRSSTSLGHNTAGMAVGETRRPTTAMAFQRRSRVLVPPPRLPSILWLTLLLLLPAPSPFPSPSFPSPRSPPHPLPSPPPGSASSAVDRPPRSRARSASRGREGGRARGEKGEEREARRREAGLAALEKRLVDTIVDKRIYREADLTALFTRAVEENELCGEGRLPTRVRICRGESAASLYPCPAVC